MTILKDWVFDVHYTENRLTRVPMGDEVWIFTDLTAHQSRFELWLWVEVAIFVA